MPQLIEPPGLGMMLMRLGEEERGQEVLDASFEADPFNVRVNNTLKVLEVLDGYATHETEHFRIRFDRQKDAILARYMGQWLEEVYPQLVEQMGFAPAGQVAVRSFQPGQEHRRPRLVQRAHGRLAAHPSDRRLRRQDRGPAVAQRRPQRFNWARVLKHEFVHVINLQQTDFNIPHWFTEAWPC